MKRGRKCISTVVSLVCGITLTLDVTVQDDAFCLAYARVN